MLVDSHCHLNMLDLAPFDGEMDALMQAAKDNGVGDMLCISVDKAHIDEVLAIAERYPHVFATVGIHPSEAVNYEMPTDEIISLADHHKVVGVGETGLDYYYNETGLDVQRASFARHIDAANALSLPIVVHTRSAKEDTLDIMRAQKAHECGGVMHCFTESWDMAKAALDMGFYISFSGIVTFKNATNVQEVAAKVPMDRLLVETDAPYLTPVPFRGKPNGPQNVRFVAEKIAQIKDLPYDSVVEQTTHNFNTLFSGVSYERKG
jgi:TatD DNase family protein